MSRVEDDHWWYVGLRETLRRTMQARGARADGSLKILDAGCGTGANLRMLQAEFRPAYLEGFDLSEEAVELAREKAPEARIHVDDLCRPTRVEGQEFDWIVSLDVIYIPGAERARPGLQSLLTRLRPGGRLLLNLPAYNWLYSEHDAAIHTSERYTRSSVRILLEELGLEPEFLSYRLCALFPLVVATRIPGMWKARNAPEAARSDLHRLPSRFVQRALGSVLSLESRGLAAGLRLPFGSSVFAIARKPGGGGR